MAKLSLRLKESTKQVETKIKKAVLKEVNVALTGASTKMIGPIRKTVKEALLRQPEVASLSGGQLAGEFGLPDGRNRIENLIEIWVNGIVVTTKKATARGGQFNGGLSVNVIQRDYKDVLSTPFATVRTEKGQELPWLEWLLRFGDKTIIRDYDVSFRPGRLARSRSGLAVMVRGKGQRWRVPAEFSGTPRNNFVTRALDSVDEEITKIVEQQLKASVS